MKIYRVVSMCTISVHTDVEANSKREAVRIARDRSMMSLCHQCSSGNTSEEWTTSGELDGTPYDLTAEEKQARLRP